ncbi:hypothetical protein CP98_03634 [Sphingobium yanoikuyae]|uniref:Uncharacterized protein n=1 Tax=Sphingobium yanoikuyae TaxID=13690 RepID=A0A084EGP4_SPHYA|nr:hypothetical protein [Sphingobium yanoikuyae]KEZ17136.1 hypothetical protein CP98_03634 [Sphingobium yanoikuyae]
MTPAHQIAEKLTEAQRRSIMEAEDMMSNHGGYPFLTAQVTSDPWPEGVAQFLTLNRDRLTPLGLAVRAHLLSKENEHD